MIFSPQPKPARTPRKSPKPLPRAKKKMRKSGRIKPKKRSASEYARIYGSEARVEFVKAIPCVGCGRSQPFVPIENAHIENDGLSRKAHYTKIVPLCGRFAPKFSCHERMHNHGREDLELWSGKNLEIEAARIEKLWQSNHHNESE